MSYLYLLLEISKYIFAATLLFDVGVFLLVLFYKNSRKVHYYFIMALGLTVFWEFTFWLALFTKLSPNSNLILNRLAFAAGPLILYFVLVFLHKFYGKALLRKYIFAILCVIALLASSLCLSNVVLIDIHFYGLASHEYSLIKGPMVIWYYIAYAPLSIYIFYVMFRIIRDVRDHRKKQAQYIVWGLFFSFLLATVSNIWLPLFFNVNENLILQGDINTFVVSLQVLGAIAITIWTSVTAYAITRHRLFDIHFIVRRWLVESVIVTMVIGIVLALLYVIVQELDGQLQTFVWIALPISIGGYFILSRLLQTYRYHSDVDLSLSPDIIHSDVAEQDMQNVLESLHVKLRDLYNVESIVFVYDWREKFFRDTSPKPAAPLMLTHPLIAYMQVQNDPIFLSELNEPNSPVSNTEHARAIIHLFREHKAQAAVPLRDSFGLLGVVFISSDSDINTLYSRNAITDIQSISKAYGSAIQRILTFQALTTKPQ